MIRDHQVGSALKRCFAIECSRSGRPAVIRVLRYISSANAMSVPARAAAPNQ